MRAQCNEQVDVALTDLTYGCVLEKGHPGAHQIAISNEFNLVHARHDKDGIFGNCEGCPTQQQFHKT